MKFQAQTLIETIRIENGNCTAFGSELSDNLFLYGFAGQTTGILCHSPSTSAVLLSVLSGTVPLTSGKIFINEEKLSYTKAAKVLSEKVAVISERIIFPPNLSVAEGFFLYSGHQKFTPNPDHYIYQLQKRLHSFTIPFSFDMKAASLTSYQNCIAQILAAFLAGRNYLVLVNPSSYLSFRECAQVLTYTADLSRLGFTIFLLDYNASFLSVNSSNLFILKDHQVKVLLNHYDKLLLTDIQDSQSIELSCASASGQAHPPVLEFRHITYHNLKAFSFSLNADTILSLCFTSDFDYRDFKTLLLKDFSPEYGDVLYKGQSLSNKKVYKDYYHNFQLIPENATATMLISSEDILYNCTYDTIPRMKRKILDNAYFSSISVRLGHYFSSDDLKRKICDLSYEEKLRVILCKILLQMPDFLVFLNPFSYSGTENFKYIKNMLIELHRHRIPILILSHGTVHLYGNSVQECTVKDGSLLPQI